MLLRRGARGKAGCQENGNRGQLCKVGQERFVQAQLRPQHIVFLHL
jgi:hypothetical protein